MAKIAVGRPWRAPADAIEVVDGRTGPLWGPAVPATIWPESGPMGVGVDAEKTFAFAVETTAEIEVLRHVVAFLMTRALLPISETERAAILATFEVEIGEMPPDSDPANPEATRFSEAVAATVPERAARFAATVRAVLETYPPPAET